MNDISQFSQCVFEPDDIIELRYLPEGKSQWITASKLSDLNGSLTQKNQAGQHIYIGANPRRSTGGTKTGDVDCARCLFVDFDSVSVEDIDFLLQQAIFPVPTLIINSGHGVHCYWRLTEPITDLAVWTKYQKRLILTLGSDKSIHDAPRIMRLPGFINHKDPVALAKVVCSNPGRRYLLRDIDENLISLEPEPKPIPASKTQPDTLTKIGRATLAAAKWPGVSEGQRDNEAFRHSAYLQKDFDLSEAEALPILQGWNATNSPPLTEKELRKTLASGGKYGNHSPGEKLNQPQTKKTIPKSGESPDDKELEIICLVNTTAKRVKWIVPEIIPCGTVTTAISQEGVGKSTIFGGWFAARITNGTPWPNDPDFDNIPGDVILLADEEDIETRITPRLQSNNADMNRVYVIPPTATPFYIEHDLDKLQRKLDALPDTKLIIFDPITSYVAGNENSNSDIRRALTMLVNFAATNNIGILGLSHLNKKVDLGMINRTIGSRAWSAVPRMVWGLRTELIEDEDGDKTETDSRFLLNIKCNLCRKPKGLKFTLGDDGKVTCEDERISMSMDDNLKMLSLTMVDECVEWLGDFMEGEIELEAGHILAEGKEQGYSEAAVNRAKTRLAIVSERVGGFGKGVQWFWKLPG